MNKLSDHDISLILELVKTQPIKEVADKFEVYPHTIRYHMKKNNANFKGYIPSIKFKEANVIEQLKTKTVSVIAKEIGVSTGTIYYQLEKQGITREGIKAIRRNNQHLLLSAIKTKINSGMITSDALKAHGITIKEYERLTANTLRASA